MNIQQQISEYIHIHTPDIIATRRFLHAHPETSFNEKRTAAYIAQRLQEAGLQVTQNIGQTGLIAELEGDNPGKNLVIRADIDALPINELTKLEFASTNGAMHACGHDGHIAMAIVAAEILAQLKNHINGKIYFVFQPAEEIGLGAIAMIKDGIMDIISDAQAVIGTHIWNQTPNGYVGINQATVFAAADMFKVNITGFGGHGAMPHNTVDPLITAANIINTAQTIVAREIPPQEMGVVTFGSIHGGNAGNVIADSVEMNGTIRAYNPETHQTIKNAMQRIITQTAKALKADAQYTHISGIPPVVNNPKIANWVARSVIQTVGEDHVGPIEPISVGDDMAEFMNRIPGTYFILGASKQNAEGHHNAKFDFNEKCLPIGTEIFVRSALNTDQIP